jgi:hypothetical protein
MEHTRTTRLHTTRRGIPAWLALAAIVALLAASWPLGAAGAATPTISLDPDRGSCETRPLVRGRGFPANARIAVFSERTNPPGEKVNQVAEATANADGTFSVRLLVINGDCIDLDNRTLEGTEYTFTAVAATAGEQSASAIFTIDRTVRERCFAETGFCVRGRFLAYWESHGGLAINGFPISNEFDQVLEDGNTYTVQYFERVRLEYHPEHAAPNNVLLGQFGRRIHGGADPPLPPPTGPLPADRVYIAETGHFIIGAFFNYWYVNDGVAQFGYPLTEEFDEVLEDGKTYRVQYFERARFEHHLENPQPYDILLGQFGRRILAETAMP